MTYPRPIYPFATFTKDPDATLDYEISWAVWLGADVITSVEWTVPTGLTKVSDDHDDTTTTVWLEGGTAGQDYDVVCRIHTAGARTDDRTLRFRVRDR